MTPVAGAKERRGSQFEHRTSRTQICAHASSIPAGILAFQAISIGEAREVIKETWLRDDLQRLRSEGSPLWDGKAKLRVGLAMGQQVAEVKAMLREKPKGSDLTIVYLVSLEERTANLSE